MQTKHLRPISLGEPYVAYEPRQTLALVHTALDGGKPGMAWHICSPAGVSVRADQYYTGKLNDPDGPPRKSAK